MGPHRPFLSNDAFDGGESTASRPGAGADVRKVLASDQRAGTFARRKACTVQRDYLRSAWRTLLPLYMLLVLSTSWPALLPAPGFVRGLVLGLSLAGWFGALACLVVIQTGTGPIMAGEQAKQWTAQKMRPLQQHGYELVNHVDVDRRGDADHVLVGPSGLWVLERKWSSAAWTATSPQLLSAARSVRDRHRRTWLQLKPKGAQGGAGVLVLWGKAAADLKARTGVAKVGGDWVVAGTHLQKWLLAQAPGQMSGEQIAACHDSLCHMALSGDEGAGAVPASVEVLVNRTVKWILLATAAFLAPWLAAHYAHWTMLLLAPLGLAAGLLTAKRGYRRAGSAIGVGAGAACLTALIGLALAV